MKSNQLKVLNMTIENPKHEGEIANAAALALQKCFIEVSRTRTVLYVENDIVWSKAPNNTPVLVKSYLDATLILRKGLLVEGHTKLKNVIIMLSTSRFSLNVHYLSS